MEWVWGVHGGGEGDGEVRTIPEGGIFRVGVPHVQACTLVAGGGAGSLVCLHLLGRGARFSFCEPPLNS